MTLQPTSCRFTRGQTGHSRHIQFSDNRISLFLPNGPNLRDAVMAYGVAARRVDSDSTSRVRALTGRRMTKQARHAGTHGVCEPPHVSEDAD